MSSSTDQLVEEMQGVFARADAVERGLTETESARVEQILGVLQSRKAMGEAGRALGVSLSGPGFGDGAGAMPGDPGSMFVHSEGFKAIANAGGRGQSWTTGLVDCGAGGGMRYKTSLLEGTGAPGSGTGGGLIPVPQVAPGVVQTLFQPVHLESLLDADVATTSTVRYINEGTATNAAAGVLEGGTKPESTLGLSIVDESVKKIATTLHTSDEMLEDVALLQNYVSSRLSLFIGLEVERQLIRGTAGNELQGLLASRGVPIYSRGTVDSYSVAVFKAMTGMRGSAYIEPEFVVMNPTDYQTTRLAVDLNGQFYGGGPFLGSYGGVQQADASGQITGATDQLWGKPVVVSNALGAGTALVGNSQSARVWSRGGLRIEATNANSTDFVQDLVTLRAERRLALTLFRANGFVEVRF